MVKDDTASLSVACSLTSRPFLWRKRVSGKTPATLEMLRLSASSEILYWFVWEEGSLRRELRTWTNWILIFWCIFLVQKSNIIFLNYVHYSFHMLHRKRVRISSERMLLRYWIESSLHLCKMNIFGIWLLVEQNKAFEDVTFGSVKLWCHCWTVKEENNCQVNHTLILLSPREERWGCCCSH